MTEYEIIKTCSYCKYKNKILFEHIGKSLKCDFCDNEFQFLSIKKINGYVYVLSNNSMPGLLKIGYTERDVKTRANEISNATGVPEPYIIEAYYGLQSPQDIEKKYIQSLKTADYQTGSFSELKLRLH